jgi:hypothetical protein
MDIIAQNKGYQTIVILYVLVNEYEYRGIRFAEEGISVYEVLSVLALNHLQTELCNTQTPRVCTWGRRWRG